MRSEAQTLVYGEVTGSDLTGNIWKPFPLFYIVAELRCHPSEIEDDKKLGTAEVGRNPRGAQDGETLQPYMCQLFNMVQLCSTIVQLCYK